MLNAGLICMPDVATRTATPVTDRLGVADAEAFAFNDPIGVISANTLIGTARIVTRL